MSGFAADDDAEPVFHSDGRLLVPTHKATGPWSPDNQHGGAVLAIVARAVEQLPSAQPMQLARLTVDMSRRVPMAPVRVDAEIVRDGLRLQSVAVTVRHDGEPVARATALRLRVNDDVVPAADVPEPWPEDAAPPPPEAGEPWDVQLRGPDFLRCFETRRIGAVEGGRGTTWLNFRPSLVDDEPVTPTVRSAASSDFVLSAAMLLGPGYITSNPDLTIHLLRLPDGPWIAIQAVARAGGQGIGQSEGVMSDRSGRFARSLKTVLIDRR